MIDDETSTDLEKINADMMIAEQLQMDMDMDAMDTEQVATNDRHLQVTQLLTWSSTKKRKLAEVKEFEMDRSIAKKKQKQESAKESGPEEEHGTSRCGMM
jgi:hypothetical protein